MLWSNKQNNRSVILRITAQLNRDHDDHWNRKRIQRLMGIMGLRGVAPGPDTSKPHPEHKIYPYLLIMNNYLSVPELRFGLNQYFEFYNQQRLHQNLDYQTPAEVYFS